MPQQRPQKSLGSGFIINNDGYILTNNHVVEGADEVQVLVDDKKKYDAKIIGTDPKTDVAVIKIEAKGLPFVSLGDSDQLQVGEWVMAVGNPFGLDHTVTAGIVSAKGRVIGAGPYDDFIQTDASINPGNSGGPLFNTKGEVIGVNTAIVASGQGIGFAIPINMAKNLIPQLISSGKVTRAWLGVGIQDITPELAKSFNLSDENGALISNIFPGSPAEKGGIKTGDIIRKFNGKDIKQSHDLPSMVALLPVGQEVEMELLRDGKDMTLKVKLGEMEKGEKAAEESTKTSSDELGLSVRDLTPEEIVENQLPKTDHGVVIVNVEPDSEATNVGVQRGDLLLSINNQKVNSSKEFSEAAKKVKTGDIVRLFIKREDSTIYLAFKK
ncbi:MAG: DegQ family serine endoprotease [Deltaproteobacteria bacterium]|nr:MAG: DegQ family serine endoprotease [Deltaproteobacteria bacterium]